MLKKWLSAFNPKYPRYIVYMLQASEYKISSYLKWHSDIKSFKKVEIRKKFVRTKKSALLLFFAWFITFLNFLTAYILIFYTNSNLMHYKGILLVLLYPFVLGYGIVLPLLFIKFLIQKPTEYYIINKAKNKLAEHQGIKIAIAGSYGKTTMREILKAVLAPGKIVAAPPENHNTLLGISSFIQSLRGDEEVLIFELGEYYKGDIKEMCELVKPDMGVITGVNEAHLEKFKNLETTTSTIFELADYLGEKTLYVNGENKIAKDRASMKHTIYSRDSVQNLKVENPKTDLSGTSFTLVIENEKFDFHSKLLGLHQIGPLLVGIKMALDLGIYIGKIQTGIANTKAFDHRLEPKTDKSGVITLDDSYNGNPDGVRAVIEFLSSLQGHRRMYMTPGLVEMGAKTEAVHIDIGKELAKSNIEKVILIKNSVTGYIEKGLKEGNYKGEVIWFDDSLKAFQALPHLTVSGDVVLLQNDWPDQYY